MAARLAGKISAEAHRARLKDAGIHRFDRRADFWPEVHLGQYVDLEIEARGNFDQFKSAAIKAENGALGHIDHLLAIGHTGPAIETDLLHSLHELAVLAFMHNAELAAVDGHFQPACREGSGEYDIL